MKKKVRINELARELEVKPNKILELLPELGVAEKKTHSSSIDEDVAIVVKQRLVGDGVGPSEDGASDRNHTAVDHIEHAPAPVRSGPQQQSAPARPQARTKHAS